MSLRATFAFCALLVIISCSEKKDDPAPVDKLVGKWTMKEKATFNRFTGMSFDTTQEPTVTCNVTIKRATSTSIELTHDRKDSPEYDYKGTLNVDWDARTITVDGKNGIEGTITDENNFTVTYIYGISSGYYAVERTYSR